MGRAHLDLPAVLTVSAVAGLPLGKWHAAYSERFSTSVMAM